MENFAKEFILKKMKNIETGGNCLDMLELAKHIIYHISETIDMLDIDYSMDVVESLKILKKDIKNLIKKNKE